MSDLETLSAKKLHEVIARCDKRFAEALDATIKAGMAELRHSDLVELAKGSSLLVKTKIALDYLNARRDWRVAIDELDRRKAYSGTDKPIKRPI